MTDQELLDSSLERLRTTGEIEYTGEFGNEITTFIPFAFWLKTQGLLEGRRVVTYKGMRPYYYFLDDDEYGERADARFWFKVPERDWPSNSTYTATKQSWHVMPNYRAHYRAQGMQFERPVLFIQNKFTVEWDLGPINFIPLRRLESLLASATKRFDVVYSRPRVGVRSDDYSVDRNTFCEYPDLAVVEKFPGVIVLEDLCARTGAPYNQTKLEILAKSHLFVAVQGGGAHLLACFGNSVMLLLHRMGDEYPHAYEKGPYKYLANPAPTLLLAKTFPEFANGVAMLNSARLEAGRLQFDERYVPVAKALKI
jgi:hypothetical protein